MPDLHTDWRRTAHQADQKRRDDEFAANEARLAEARKRAEARKKETERRAALSPPERAAEDEKRAQMTPEQRLEDDESKGLSPEQFDEINPLVAGPPSFAPLTEGAHSAEFILSESPGMQSRDAGTIVDPGSVRVGQTLKITTPATLTAPAIFGPNVTTDTACDGIAIYAITTSGANANIAVLTRNAEVNGNLLYYPGTITGTDKLNIFKALAVHGVIIR